MKCRKRIDVIETGPRIRSGTESGGYLLPAQAVTGIEAARARLRLLCGTWEPIASMRRENSQWWTHEEESTEARRRGGSARSSEEAQ
jgi:hypothetical protein